ncbi:MAG: hypothetical protein OXC48_02630 [Endozoicomonadaceae bacterium]|nr:hypothetical protein [Endozoicomonadaceae bacterium]
MNKIIATLLLSTSLTALAINSPENVAPISDTDQIEGAVPEATLTDKATEKTDEAVDAVTVKINATTEDKQQAPISLDIKIGETIPSIELITSDGNLLNIANKTEERRVYVISKTLNLLNSKGLIEQLYANANKNSNTKFIVISTNTLDELKQAVSNNKIPHNIQFLSTGKLASFDILKIDFLSKHKQMLTTVVVFANKSGKITSIMWYF